MHSCNLQRLHQRLWRGSRGLALGLVALWADDIARTLALMKFAQLERWQVGTKKTETMLEYSII